MSISELSVKVELQTCLLCVRKVKMVALVSEITFINISFILFYTVFFYCIRLSLSQCKSLIKIE